jgi:hypothetical protein
MVSNIKLSLMKRCKRKSKPEKTKMEQLFRIQMKINNKKRNQLKLKLRRISLKEMNFQKLRKNQKIDSDFKLEVTLRMMIESISTNIPI